MVAFILLFIIGLVHHEESLSKKKGENPKSETLPILDKLDCKNGKKSCKTGRSAEYCYLHREKGSEGSNSGASNAWKLAHVVINLRHGDRTSIHSLGWFIIKFHMTSDRKYFYCYGTNTI